MSSQIKRIQGESAAADILISELHNKTVSFFFYILSKLFRNQVAFQNVFMRVISFFENIVDIVARYCTIHVDIGGMEQDFTCHIVEYFLEACPLLLAEFTKELWRKGTAFSAAQVKEDENMVPLLLLFFIQPLLLLLGVLSIRRAGGTRRRLLVFTTVGPLALTFVCNGSGSTVVHEEKKMIKKKKSRLLLDVSGK